MPPKIGDAAITAKGSGLKKDEQLHQRIDKRISFALDWSSALKHTTRPRTVEDALESLAQALTIGDPGQPKRWTDYYDDSEAVREIRLTMDPDFPASAQRIALRQFLDDHRPFFFFHRKRGEKFEVNPAYAEALWSKIDDFVELWQKTRSKDWWAAGRAMQKNLEAANLTPPEWGKAF